MKLARRCFFYAKSLIFSYLRVLFLAFESRF